MSAHKTVDAVAGIVRMELNDPAEMASAQLMFEDLNFRLDRSFPELAVEIASSTRMPRVVLEPGRIADRINIQGESFPPTPVWLRFPARIWPPPGSPPVHRRGSRQKCLRGSDHCC
jgi:hypothetical protein